MGRSFVLYVIAAIVALAGVVLAAALFIPSPALVTPDRVVLVSPDGSERADVQDEVAAFRRAGYVVTSDADRVLAAAEARELTALVLTRSTVESVPVRVLSGLYGGGVAIVALDVSREELAPMVRGVGGSHLAGLPEHPERSKFILASQTAACGSSSLSTWLGVFNLQDMVSDITGPNPGCWQG